MKPKNIIKISAVIVSLIAVMGLLYLLYINYVDKPVDGAKNITLEVEIPDESIKEFKIKTSEEFLSEALLDEKLIEGANSTYGFFIKKVNGILADSEKQEWWCLTKSGESLTTGVSATPIYDGDVFKLTLTVGW